MASVIFQDDKFFQFINMGVKDAARKNGVEVLDSADAGVVGGGVDGPIGWGPAGGGFGAGENCQGAGGIV